MSGGQREAELTTGRSRPQTPRKTHRRLLRTWVGEEGGTWEAYHGGHPCGAWQLLVPPLAVSHVILRTREQRAAADGPGGREGAVGHPLASQGRSAEKSPGNHALRVPEPPESPQPTPHLINIQAEAQGQEGACPGPSVAEPDLEARRPEPQPATCPAHRSPGPGHPFMSNSLGNHPRRSPSREEQHPGVKQ